MMNLSRMKMLGLLLLLMALCIAPAALAEDVCTVQDAASASRVTTECSYLRVLCPLDGETDVTLSVQDEWGYLIYQRNYGRCAGTFRSGDVHLPLNGDSCRYTVTLSTDTDDHSFTVVREAPLLTDSAVYAGGMTLREMVNGSSRKYAVVLDLHAMNQETLIAPMLASGMQVGEVYFSVLDGKLTVSAYMLATGQIDKANVYIAADALTAQTLGTSHFTGVRTRLDRTVDLGDSPYAAVMVQLTVSYDPTTALAYAPDRAAERELQELRENWQLMQLTTANEAVG